MNIVVTTIFPPRQGPMDIAAMLNRTGGTLWILGDQSGPAAYDLPHTRLVTLDDQKKLPFQLAGLLPVKHYTRKNMGYLLAMKHGAEFIVETDDDNIPEAGFWNPRNPVVNGGQVDVHGWFNVYSLFTADLIWPRGLPLEHVKSASNPRQALTDISATCYMQQGLTHGEPDVDAIFRLTHTQEQRFIDRPPVVLEKGTWCPFNSQNTTTFTPAFPLLYLPSFCTFRMTDIWRSFVAQRCLWAMDSRLVFTAPTMRQERNEHNLLRDFEQEIPGYLQNDKIRLILEGLDLKRGTDAATVCHNLEACYLALTTAGIIDARENALVKAWCADVRLLLDGV